MTNAKKLVASLEGNWAGSCRTWFQPNQLADESPIEGTFKRLLDAGFLRHEYSSALKGKPRTGEETLVFNPAAGKFETSWIDSFHMNYGILFSVGEATDDGFAVVGKYDVGPEHPPWGWKTVYQLVDEDHLTITSYNISPEGEEAKAVEVEYTRVK